MTTMPTRDTARRRIGPDVSGARRSRREPALSRFLFGGCAGTLAITLMMYFVDPLITGRTLDIARMLGAGLGSSHWAGAMAVYFFHGVVLFPLGFAFFSARLPGPGLVKGLTWGAILWALDRGVAMPLMGAGFFGYGAGSPMAALSSLAGYLAYGSLLGLLAGSRPGRDAA